MEIKKKEQLQRRTKMSWPSLNPIIQFVIVNLYIIYEVSILNGFLDTFETNTVLNAWRERKVNIYRDEQTEEGQLSIPRYNLSWLTSIQNMNLLYFTVVEISLTKIMERKKKEQIQGTIDSRMPIRNPTLQHVIVKLKGKFLSL